MISTEQIAYYKKYFDYIEQKIRFEGLTLDEISIVSLKNALGGKQQTCKQALKYYRDVYCVNGVPISVSEEVDQALASIKQKVDEILPVMMQFAAMRVNSYHDSLLNDLDDAQHKINNLQIALSSEKDSHRANVSILEEKLSASEALASTQANEIRRLLNETDAFKSELAELNKSMINTSLELQKTKDTCINQASQYQEQLTKDNRKIEQLNISLNDAIQSSRDFESAYLTSENKLNESAEKYVKIELALSNAHKKLEQANSNSIQLQKANDSLTEQIEIANKKIEHLASDIDATVQDKSNAESALAKTNNELIALRADYSEQTSAFALAKHEIHSLKSEVIHYKEKYDYALEVKDLMKQRLQQVEEHNASLRSMNDSES